MALELDTITSGYNTSKINSNFQKIEDSINDDVLKREIEAGESNEMRTHLDLNNQRVVNGLDAVDNSDMTTFRQLNQIAADANYKQGIQGIQGETGAQGVQGLQGFEGDIGPQGITGLQGGQGIEGAQGITGLTGAQGTQGITGLQGTTGIQGIQGIPGEDGTSFAVDASGPFSGRSAFDTEAEGFSYFSTDTVNPDLSEGAIFFRVTATPGVWGDPVPFGTGATGEVGPDGVPGIQGEQGPPGVQGPVGDQGVQGINGVQGPVGDQGATGATGATGAQGSIGPTGAQGSQGIQGTQGEVGPTGLPGIQGEQGEPGDDFDGDARITVNSNDIAINADNIISNTNNIGKEVRTWQDYTGSRILSATYVAPLSREIRLRVVLKNYSGFDIAAKCKLQISDMVVDELDSFDVIAVEGTYTVVTGPIPASTSYKFIAATSSQVIVTWEELR